MAVRKSDENSEQNLKWEEFLGGVDTETRPHELDSLKVSVRDTELYLPAATKRQMDYDHGSPVTMVVTRTLKEEGKVQWAAAPNKNIKGIRRVRSTDTLGGAYVAFGIPLRKLDFKPPEERSLVLDVARIPLANGKVIYEVSFAEFQNDKRDLDENKRAEKKEAQAQKRQQRRAARTRQKKTPEPGDAAQQGA